jgi:hypothetical protein
MLEKLGTQNVSSEGRIEKTLMFTSPDTPEQNGQVEWSLLYFGAEYKLS